MFQKILKENVKSSLMEKSYNLKNTSNQLMHRDCCDRRKIQISFINFSCSIFRRERKSSLKIHRNASQLRYSLQIK